MRSEYMKYEEALKILKFYEKELKDAPCSEKHHLNIRGGLLIHLYNVKNAAIEIDPKNEQLHALALIHDIGKARTYVINDKNWISYAKPGVDHLINTIVMIAESGYKLTQEELHSLQFHHGGWSPFSKNANLTELAIKLHTADMLAMTRENNNDHSKKD
jgi:23S rRNA maturation-related 3'-5' exoribonuclease YhaM